MSGGDPRVAVGLQFQPVLELLGQADREHACSLRSCGMSFEHES